MSLVSHETTEELQKLLELFTSQPNFYDYLMFTNPIRIQLGPGFPPALKIYSFEKNGTTYFILHREWKVVVSHECIAAVGPVSRDDLFEALQHFNREVGIFTDNKHHVLAGTADLVTLTVQFHRKACPEAQSSLYPCHRYYMSEEQKKMMLASKMPALPEGYQLGIVNHDDCEILVKNWRHSGASEIEHTRNKVKLLPNSAIRYKGELVGHEIVDGCGILTNQFVHPDHRGKGLGTVLEMDISKKLIGLGFDVLKHVELYNEAVINMTNRSKFWTLANNSGSSESSTMFTILNEAVSHASV